MSCIPVRTSATSAVCDDDSLMYYSNHAGSRYSREERGPGRLLKSVLIRRFIFPVQWSFTLTCFLSFAHLPKGDQGLPGNDGARGVKGDGGQKGEKVRNQRMMMFMEICVCSKIII